ncbi:MAG: hypothetical protein ACJA2S_001958 [Cyclobacteriaceae bacterium]|jgi:hypothetical protein
MYEEERLKRTLQLTETFSAPITINTLLIPVENDPVIILIDSTIYNMNAILADLNAVSGGRDENGQYINAYGIEYVNAYFYGENHFRNNAIEFFDSIINNYLQNIESVNFESNLKKVYEIKTDYYNWPIFEKMTVAESTVLIQSICQQILADKYNYLLSKYK